ncbi:MAG: lipid II flippase MurJ, partial [bacterium]
MAGEGAITALTYANRMMLAPLGVFGSAVSMAIFPTLSRQAGAGEYERMGRGLARAVRATLIFSLPFTALF